jgi:hypothetical protein
MIRDWGDIQKDQWSIEGNWRTYPEYIEAFEAGEPGPYFK